MNKNILDHTGSHVKKLFATVIAMFPMALAAEETIQTNNMELTLALRGDGQDVLWVSLGATDYHLVATVVALFVFFAIIRLVIGND